MKTHIDESEKCACGGKIVYGSMYGDQFVAGTVDLSFAFRGKEYLLKELFPHSIPTRGKAATMCSKCFRIDMYEQKTIHRRHSFRP